jgi:tRNA nucleotidyltransferase (CCA-adding enzyme)
MLPVFSDHPLIEQFNELKRYFRRHETSETRARVEEFREYARIISLAGMDMAFDFMGSMNFGQALPRSDVDVVMYLDCQEHADSDCGLETCEHFGRAQTKMLRTLIETYSDHPYEVQVIDCINLF